MMIERAMHWLPYTVIAFYLGGAIGFSVLNLAIGPVSPGLAFLRGALWPIWITTGHPEGTRCVADFEADGDED